MGRSLLQVLKIGVIFAIFQSDGTVPESIEIWSNRLKGSEREWEHSRKTNGWIWSGPMDLDTFSILNLFSISIGSKVIGEIDEALDGI